MLGERRLLWLKCFERRAQLLSSIDWGGLCCLREIVAGTGIDSLVCASGMISVDPSAGRKSSTGRHARSCCGVEQMTDISATSSYQKASISPR